MDEAPRNEPADPFADTTGGERATYVGGLSLAPLPAPADAEPPAGSAAAPDEPGRAGSPAADMEPATGSAAPPATRPDGLPERRGKPRGYVPPRQRAPVVKFVLSLMPAEVRTAFDARSHEALFTTDPPAPATGFESRKVDVMLALHASVRDGIERWEDRMFQAFGLSMAAMLSVVGVYLEHPAELGARRLLVALLVLTIGSLAGLYFWRAADAHSANGALLVKVEAALGLCEEGAYLEDVPFYGWTGVWVPDRRSPVLFTALVVVTFFATLVILLYPVSAG